jgi:methylmalonyl-CoA/ethylmalonyl-CoA epimerase
MIGRLNHVAIAVRDLDIAIRHYRDTLGAKVSEPLALPDHGVTCSFVDLGNSKIELLEPLGEDSPIIKFLERNPAGGVHHLCFEVPDIDDATDKISRSGARIVGARKPKIGAHGNPVVFLHPNDFFGTLIELEQVEAKAIIP